MRFAKRLAAASCFAASCFTAAITAPASAQIVDLFPISIFFEPGSADLSRFARPLLDNAVLGMGAIPGIHMVIAGHADSAGPRDRNLRLSCRRARVAHAYLLARGIAPQLMTVVGFGEDRPDSLGEKTPSAVNRRVNRRVEMSFLDSSQVGAEIEGSTPC
jgi:outer membrane protein OmpA-like peptidoglycan-associated protein